MQFQLIEDGLLQSSLDSQIAFEVMEEESKASFRLSASAAQILIDEN